MLRSLYLECDIIGCFWTGKRLVEPLNTMLMPRTKYTLIPHHAIPKIRNDRSLKNCKVKLEHRCHNIELSLVLKCPHLTLDNGKTSSNEP